MLVERRRNWIANRQLLDVSLFFAGCLSIALQVPNAAFATVLSLCTMVAHGLHAALLPRLSDLFFHDRRPGIWAALIAILLPVPHFFPLPEGIFCAVGLMLFCLVTDRRLSRGGAGGALFAGLFAGVLTLLNPVCPVVCGFWLLYLLWRRRVAFAARSVELIALAFVATFVPLFFMRENLGRELGVFWFVTAGGFKPLRGFHDFLPIDAHYRAPILWASLLGIGYLISSAVAAVHRKPVARIESNVSQFHLLE